MSADSTEKDTPKPQARSRIDEHPRAFRQLRDLDIDDVGSAPVIYLPIAATIDDDLILACPVPKRRLPNLKQPNASFRLSLLGLSRVIASNSPVTKRACWT
jgi:hypothetical protein